jgi:hypothetical protein
MPRRRQPPREIAADEGHRPAIESTPRVAAEFPGGR